MPPAVDDVEGGRKVVKHLLTCGTGWTAFVGRPLFPHQVVDRHADVQAAVVGGALEMVETTALTVVGGRRASEQIITRTFGQRPDAIFAADELLAVGLLQALAFTHRLHVSEDVALIDYDSIEFATLAIVPLSSIRQPVRLIGGTAVELLEDEITDPDPHRVNF